MSINGVSIDFIWQALLLIAVGFLLLRLAGRKSISQLTIPTTVVMISIGSIIITPIVEKNIWRTVGAASIFILFLMVVEYLEMKFNWIEKLLTGDSVVVIEDGKLVEPNLRRVRVSVDKLEVRLRQKGIKRIADVKTATIEPNGQLGYELFYDAEPLTVGEFKKMMNFLSPQIQQASPSTDFTLFDEVKQGKHPTQVSKHLQ